MDAQICPQNQIGTRCCYFCYRTGRAISHKKHTAHFEHRIAVHIDDAGSTQRMIRIANVWPLCELFMSGFDEAARAQRDSFGGRARHIPRRPTREQFGPHATLRDGVQRKINDSTHFLACVGHPSLGPARLCGNCAAA